MQLAETAESTPQLERYVLRRRIAVGGMAEVFEASDSQSGERVVVKLLLPHLCNDAEVLQMFADEAQLTTQLDHAHLVRTLDTGQLAGRPYLVMELVDGCTLDALIKRCGALTPAVAARVTKDTLEALVYLHGYADATGRCLHIVHRDVNPRNVLLSRAGQVKLTDFGIARSRMRAARTRSGVIKGTVQYMSPEQITGSEPDHRADLYGVGLVLFELLTGRPYIEGAQEIDLLRLAETPPWRPPSRVNTALSAAFDELLQPALMRFPEQRYRDARAFLHALEQTLDATNISAASAEDLGQLVAEQPARSTTVPPLTAEMPAHHPDSTEMPAHPAPKSKTATPTQAPGSVDARRTKGGHRALLATGTVVALALAGGALWSWRADDTNTRSPASPTIANRAEPATPNHTPTPSPAVPIATATPRTSPTTTAPSAPGRVTDEPARAILTSSPADSPSEQRATARTVSARGIGTTPTTPRARRKPRREEPRSKTQPTRGPRIGKPQTDAPEQPQPTASDAELTHATRRLARLRETLRRRGVLAADLPAEARQSLTGAANALAQKDLSAAQSALAQLEQHVAQVAVNRDFVQRKLNRVDRALRRLPADRHDVQQLRQRSTQALQAFMDGNFEGANRQLNRILTSLPHPR